eukprot:604860-Rhodomonas_salina.2
MLSQPLPVVLCMCCATSGTEQGYTAATRRTHGPVLTSRATSYGPRYTQCETNPNKTTNSREERGEEEFKEKSSEGRRRRMNEKGLWFRAS